MPPPTSRELEQQKKDALLPELCCPYMPCSFTAKRRAKLEEHINAYHFQQVRKEEEEEGLLAHLLTCFPSF